MQCIVDRKALMEAVRVLSRLTKGNTAVPVLRCLHLKVDGRLTLTATDLEQTARITLSATGDGGSWEGVIEAKKIGEVLTSGKSKDVTLMALNAADGLAKDGIAKMKGVQVDAMRFNLPFDVADYPDMPIPDGVLLCLIPAKAFEAAAKLVAYCTGDILTRYSLTGVFLDVSKKSGVNLVASDGMRMTWQHVAGAKAGMSAGILLTPKMIETIRALAKGHDGDVEFLVKKNEDGGITTVHARIGEASVYGCLIEGRFPDYRKIVPLGEPGGTWSVPVVALAEALAKSLPASVRSEGGRTVWTVRLTGKKDALEIHAKNETCEATADVEAKGQGNRDIVLNLNPKFMGEYLRSLPSTCKHVILFLRDSHSATIWKAEGIEGHMYLLMPFNIGV